MIFENGMSYLEELIVFSNDIDYSENAWLYTLLVLLAYAKRALGGMRRTILGFNLLTSCIDKCFQNLFAISRYRGKKILAKAVLNP